MSVFVDTSAILALLNSDDENHIKAAREWERLLSEDSVFVSTNYVLVEAIAILQHRFGMEAVRVFQESVVPLLSIVWIDESVHRAGIMSVMVAARRGLSFVDCVSFHTMRQMGINSAFAFDADFQTQGFECVPV